MKFQMKFLLAGIVALLVSIVAPSHSSTEEHRAQAPAPEINRKPVVVELFTSEGCSSCPPADAFLTKLEDQQPIEGADIVALEEHVDYWNQQGWIDPFSAVEWTQRQREYASVFKLDDVYTPQVIVDGQKQFIGGRIQEVVTEIAGAARRPKTDVVLTPEAPAANDTAQLTVRVRKLLEFTEKDTVEVLLAVTEKGLGSSVSRGENAGKSLHASIVELSPNYARPVDGIASSGSSSGFKKAVYQKYRACRLQSAPHVAPKLVESPRWNVGQPK